MPPEAVRALCVRCGGEGSGRCEIVMRQVISLTFLEVFGWAVRAVDLASGSKETLRKASSDRVTVAGQRRIRTGFAALAEKRSSIPERVESIVRSRF
jgi:hypothetical protein